MKKKLPALLAFCILGFAGSAQALQTDELIAITTMPLAVAEVVALPDLPRDDFFTVVTTLNRAAVPAPQFIEVVRYAPVALVEPAQPAFVTYVTQEFNRGVIGEPLALAIADRYQTYGFVDVDVVDPPVITVVERRILPPVVVTRFQPVEFDPLALIAMPLAVAAVADLADVPRTDLFRFITSLNLARVPAPQFVEIVRYSPVVFVDAVAAPQFVQFVTTEIDRGIIGRPLAFTIADRLRVVDADVIDIDIVDPQPLLIVDRDTILPPVVVTRAARAHPHGGPPGQLKKELGLQTGAEVVHGTDRGERRVSEGRVKPRKVRSSERTKSPRVTSRREVRREKPQRVHSAPRATPEQRVKPAPAGGQRGGGQQKPQKKQEPSGGKGKGKGKGKG